MLQKLVNFVIYLAIVVLGFFLADLACGQGRYVVPCSDRLRVSSMDSLATFVGIVETTGRNDGYRVGAMLSHVGLRAGYAWCAATVVARFDTARGNERLPVLRSAGAVPIYNDGKRRGKLSTNIPRVGDCLVWKHPGSTAGHIGAGVISVKYPYVLQIEGNTTQGTKGNQRDGGGCYRRIRKYGPLGSMQLLGCIGFAPATPSALQGRVISISE